MKYVQLNPNGSYKRTVDENEVIKWSDDCEKQPKKLTDDEKYEFNVFVLVETPWPVFDPRTHWIREIDPVLINSVPTQRWQVLDLPAEQVQTTFDTVKKNKREQINEWRAKANQTSFTFAGKQIESDTLSRSDIDAVAGSVALTGEFPQGFPNLWKALDNTYVPIPDVATFKQMYNAMTLQGAINFGKAQALKQELEQADTFAEVDAVVWN